MKCVFIYTDEKSSKFWSIEMESFRYIVTSGKIGTAGKSENKTYMNEEDFQEEVNKMITRIIKRGYVETDSGNKLLHPEKKEVKDRDLVLLHKYPRNYKNDVIYAFTEGKPSYNNPYALNKLHRKFGYHNPTNQAFNKLMVLVQKELAAKKPLPKEKLIKNAYHILDSLQLRVPLKRLTDIINGIAEGKPVPETNVPNRKHEWDFWELPNPVRGTPGSDIQCFSIDFDKKEDVETMLKQLVERFDQYLLVWNYSQYPDWFSITNLSVAEESSGYRNTETGSFKAAIPFPELALWVAAYVEKITQTNQIPLLLQERNGVAKPRGVATAAVTALIDDKTDEKLLAYLNTIPMEFLEFRMEGCIRA